MPIITSSDGSHTLVSPKYGVTYHSKFGAVTESEHVFIQGGLRWKSAEKNEISVLEVGFGTGLNAFMSRLEAERAGLKVRYVTLETDPVAISKAETLNYPEVLNALARAEDFLQLHRCPWGVPQRFSEHFVFEKRLLPLQQLESENEFDLIYFDAFDPKTQPEMWEAVGFVRLFRALKTGGALVTYCAQGEFRRRLRKAGFKVERSWRPRKMGNDAGNGS